MGYIGVTTRYTYIHHSTKAKPAKALDLSMFLSNQYNLIYLERNQYKKYY
jgi:hypothetical protein